MEFGKYNDLEMLREVSIGMFLGDEAGNDILLPMKYYHQEDFKVGEKIRVFVYKDSEGRPISTTRIPKLTLNEFAYLEVTMTNRFGAFVDWGLEKNLFVPFDEQSPKMKEGEWHIIYMYWDAQSERLVGSGKVHRFLDNSALDIEEGEEVEAMIWEPTELGANVIINQKYKGLIYDSNIFVRLREGEIRRAYVKKIRDDNKLDISLQPEAWQAIDPNAAIILERLEAANGFLPLNDKTDPLVIAREMEMSKKNFKKAIGALYKQRLIDIEEDGIRIVGE